MAEHLTLRVEFFFGRPVSFINIKFSRCKGCETTVGDSYDLRSYAFSSSVYVFLISSRVYYQCFLSFFVLLIKNCHCVIGLWILTKIQLMRKLSDEDSFPSVFWMRITSDAEWQKFASSRSANLCVNARNPSTNSTRAKVGRDIILWTRRSDGSDKRNVGRTRSVARSLTIISLVTSWKNNFSHRDREATI